MCFVKITTFHHFPVLNHHFIPPGSRTQHRLRQAIFRAPPRLPRCLLALAHNKKRHQMGRTAADGIDRKEKRGDERCVYPSRECRSFHWTKVWASSRTMEKVVEGWYFQYTKSQRPGKLSAKPLSSSRGDDHFDCSERNRTRSCTPAPMDPLARCSPAIDVMRGAISRCTHG